MLDKVLKETAHKHPDKTAIVYESQRISFQELYNNVAALSNGLHSVGIKEGDCIALILPNCPEFIISFFAAAKLNTVMLPMNPVLVENEFSYFIIESDAAAIITDTQHADICRSIIASAERKIELIVIDGTHSSDTNFNDLIKNQPVSNVKTTSYEGNVLYQYSSGSTGRPKRVCKTQKNLYHEAFNFTSTTDINKMDNIMCVTPLFHAHGLGNCMLASAFSGASLIIMEDLKKNGVVLKIPFVFRRERVLELIEKENVTILPGVPFIFNALAETPDTVQSEISSLRLCFSGGNFLLKQTFDKFMERFGVPIKQQYGCTEAGSISINVDSGDNIKYDSAGLPMNNVDVQIVNDNDTILTYNTVGEIVVKSEALTSGYYNMPELNKDAFKNGYFFTGDLGKKDENGQIFITGRKKIFIDTGGNKVDPLEIEDILITHPKVEEAVVVGVKGSFDDEIIKAVIVPKGKCSDREILSYCKEKLTSFKVPQQIEFRDEIPKSPLGKILRKDLI